MLMQKNVGKIKEIFIDDIYASKNQPRNVFKEEAIVELAKSIAENGILQPITVRRVDKKYEIIAGERRYRAAKLIHMDFVPCIVLNCDDERVAVLSLIENIQRQDLDPFEEAFAIKRLIMQSGVSQEYIAKKLGKSPAAISNKLRLLKLTPEEISKLRGASLCERHARAFIRIADIDARTKLIDFVIEKNLNVSQTEALISKQLENKPKNKSKIVIKDIRIFMNTLSKAVEMMKRSGINAQSVKNETNDFIEYIVKIPKS